MSSTFQATFEVMQIIEAYLKCKSKSSREYKVLDVGCGFGKNGALVKHLCLQHKVRSYVVGVDIWSPYLHELNSMKTYNLLLLGDARELPFRTQLFDIVIVTEIIEHMEKHVGLLFLKDLEKMLGKDGILVISTPQGREVQQAIEGNKYQEHQSVWMKKDLELLGFQVFTSPLVLRTPVGLFFVPMRRLPNTSRDVVMNMLLFLLSATSFMVPSISGKLIAYKFKTQ
jgi:ubiquinone/menaquinone biosynthesis C-methylase UbiE